MATERIAVAVTRRRFNVDEYHRMAEAGILCEDERLELIDGEVIVRMTIGPGHNACVTSATRAFVRAAGDDALVLPQGSVRLSRFDEPEPDLVLLRPRADFYSSRHARPDDILLVVEIAASSIEYDLELKGPRYAEFGVPEYWIADLNADLVRRHLTPESRAYRSVMTHRRGESLVPALLPSCVIAVDALLIE